jgi:hypothetical protein
MNAVIAILRELRCGFVKQPVVVVELDIGATASGAPLPTTNATAAAMSTTSTTTTARTCPPCHRSCVPPPGSLRRRRHTSAPRTSWPMAMGGSSIPSCTSAVYTLSIFGSQPPELAYHQRRFSCMSLDVKLVRACTLADERIARLVVW